MIKEYYYLTKPGIIYGNSISMVAGFLLASGKHFDLTLFLAALIGLSLVIAAACVFNNIWDKDIDQSMDRTKNRAMVTGAIPKTHALVFGVILLSLGVLILTLYTNLLTLGVGLVGFFVYVLAYTPLKRRSVHATLIGAISGATPPVAGYTAVVNKFDACAIILFLILVFWQMPHFYSIAIRRLKDYTAAGLPVLPAVKGILVTKINILIYMLGFIISMALLTIYGYTGYIFLVLVLILGLYWLAVCLQGFRKDIFPAESWAKKMFFTSLWVLLILCALISVSARLA
ncbi:MAG: heme o synthase [Candidatus Doudnabacteria bacterium]|nr:heme o synthase [Candidatus Doudnabacteria bacterium]